jgi:hypothetical protein
MFITYTQYPSSTKKVMRSNGVTLFASGYRCAGSISQLPDGKTETIAVQEVVHLLRSFNRIAQSQIMHNDVQLEVVNHYGLNLYNHHGKLIGTAPQGDGIFVLDRVQVSTEYSDIDNSCLLALKITGQASRHNTEKRMFLTSPPGTCRVQGFADLAKSRCLQSVDDREVPLQGLHRGQIRLKALYSECNFSWH